jgi:LPXTG-site transpeptidase (sortase) family protein
MGNIMQFRRLTNYLSVFAGLAVLGLGLFGIFGPNPQVASTPTQEDPSLVNGGFNLPTAEHTPVFSRSWVRVTPATPGIGPTVTLLPSTTPTPTLRAKADIIEPTDAPAIPDRVVIPVIKLDAPIVVAPTRKLTIQQQVFEQWLAPDDFAVGWHTGSAFLGQTGNTVLNGHHNVFGKVFGRLVELVSGDTIILYAGIREYRYVVAQSMILRERGAPLSEREANAQWILPSDDERLTLVTCWPADNNTHRLLIVARPIKD